MFQLHQERDGFIRFAGERNYRPGEGVHAAAILASSKCGSDYVYTHSAIAKSSALPWIGDKPPFRWAVVFTLCAFLNGLV